MTRIGRSIKITLAILAGLIAPWLAGFLWFGATMPDRRGPLPRAGAIVVLTGGAERVAVGLKLLAANRAPVLLISGVHPTVRKADLLRMGSPPRRDLAPRIFLGYRAQTTVGNAREVATWARQRRLRSLIVVTANYHLRRSLLELRQALPKTRLIAAPVFPKAVPARGWWRSWQGLRIVATEFNKYIAAVIRSLIA